MQGGEAGDGQAAGAPPGTAVVSPSRFGLGILLADMLGLIRRHPGLVGVTAAACALPSLIAGLSAWRDPASPGAPADLMASLGSLALWVPGQALAVAIIVQTAIRDLRGMPVAVGVAAAGAMRHLGPAIVTSGVASVLIMPGLMALVVPGLVLMVVWFVAVPVAAVEGIHPMKSLARSTALTAGSRWPIVGYLLVVWLAFGALAILVGEMFDMAEPQQRTKLILALGLLQILWTALAAVAAACAYCRLATIDDGTAMERIAAAPDRDGRP